LDPGNNTITLSESGIVETWQPFHPSMRTTENTSYTSVKYR